MMIEVLKQMVEALQTYGDKHRDSYLLEGAWDEEITKGDAAIKAGKQAIAAIKAGLQAIAELERQETNHVTLTQTNVGIVQRAEEAFEAAKKRGWVGLTDEEIDDAARYCVKSGQSVNAAIRAIEAKLKEKNS